MSKRTRQQNVGIATEIVLALAEAVAVRVPPASHIDAVMTLVELKFSFRREMIADGYVSKEIEAVMSVMSEQFGKRWHDLSLEAVRKRDQQPDEALDAEPA